MSLPKRSIRTLTMEFALREMGVPFESHIYSYGGHAFATADTWLQRQNVSERVPHWVDDSLGWLREIFQL